MQLLNLRKSILILIGFLLFTFVQSNGQNTHNGLFKLSTKKNDIDRIIKEYTPLTLDFEKTKEIKEAYPKQLFLKIPRIGEEDFDLVLMKHDIFKGNPSFNAITDKGKEAFNYSPGAYYKGYIKGDENSFVSISIFNNEVMGMIVNKEGNFILGKLGERSERGKNYILYNDKNLLVHSNFKCDTKDDDFQIPKKQTIPLNKQSQINLDKCVGIYLECDSFMYANFNSDTQMTIDYATNLFNQVAVLYDNENILVRITNISVWTIQDIYAEESDNSVVLSDFANYNSMGAGAPMNGDLGHLLSMNAIRTGGLASVDVLCHQTLNYGINNIDGAYDAVPVYSWDVYVLAHEIGHNMGSPHTHSCSWGQNGDQQIDDCGNIDEGSGGACFDPMNPILPEPFGSPAPASGTIMSYCHLLNGSSGLPNIGIDFINGFGQEPGDLIRYEVNVI